MGAEEFRTRARANLEDRVGRPAEEGQMGEVDPHCRLIVMHLYHGLLKARCCPPPAPGTAATSGMCRAITAPLLIATHALRLIAEADYRAPCGEGQQLQPRNPAAPIAALMTAPALPLGSSCHKRSQLGLGSVPWLHHGCKLTLTPILHRSSRWPPAASLAKPSTSGW